MTIFFECVKLIKDVADSTHKLLDFNDSILSLEFAISGLGGLRFEIVIIGSLSDVSQDIQSVCR